jgi:tRNA acetyltransferase TAN1
MVELTKNDLKTALKLAKTSIHKKYEIVPIESVVLTRPELIIKQIINMSKNRIKDGETFAIRCNVRGRRYIKSKEEFISTIYREIGKLNGRPDDNHPDWIIHIEVIGENTGLSVLKRNI